MGSTTLRRGERTAILNREDPTEKVSFKQDLKEARVSFRGKV